MNKEMLVKSYAKINLSLNVLDKKENGYHSLDTIMLPIELHDFITIEILPKEQNTFITCDEIRLAAGEHNIVEKVIKLLRERFNFRDNFRISITKNIPVAAGLGGGSSNAAAVLYAVAKLLNLSLTQDDYLEIAKKLGADVTFFLYNHPARVRNIGDELTSISVSKNYYVLLVKPDDGLSTKIVFQKSDTMSLIHPNIDKVQEALANGDDEMLANTIGNSLEKPAIVLLKDIDDIKRTLFNEGLKIVLMSGAGSCVFAMSSDKKLINKAAKTCLKNGYLVEVTKLLL